jgi:carboxyl-terminal processing protease
MDIRRVAVATALLIWPLVQFAYAGSGDPAFAMVQEAYEHIRANYADRIDEAKILDAAIAAMLKASSAADPNIAKTTSDAQNGDRLGAASALFDRLAATNDKQRLADAAIASMIGTLDSHSSYLDPVAWQSLLANQKIGGIGLNIAMGVDAIRVDSPIANGPADKAGIAAGDLIVAINGAPVSGLSLRDVVAKFRGPIDSEIVLTVFRSNGRGQTDIAIRRADVHQQAIYAAILDNAAILRVTRFNDQTAADLKSALDKLKSQTAAKAVKGYVIDLRDNPGGLLDGAIAFAGAFLGNGPIATTSARDRETQRFESKSADVTGGKPIAVIVNGNTAAGAEIVAGALQFNRRATIVGTRSAGAGTIQTVYPLADSKAALRLTTSRIILPSGHDLDAAGITPDKIVEQPLQPASSGQGPAPDRQLQTALALVTQQRR